MRIRRNFLRFLVILVPFLILVAGLGTLPAGATSQYFFTYYLGDGSGDRYQGYVYAPDGWLAAGSTIYNQPAPLGGGSLKGHYAFTSVVTGYSSYYDKQEIINAYYDADTGKTSQTFYASTGGTTTGTVLQITDRSTKAETGYVYDPSVPSDDAYFGNADSCYSFSSASSSANFLAKYITGLRYWNQPSDYQNSCEEVASAILLSWWDNNGYPNAITADWKNLWADDTADVASYESLLKTLGPLMGYTSTGGSYDSMWGSGLKTYMTTNQGYSGFNYTRYDVSSDRSSTLTAFKAALVAGMPVAIRMEWSAGGHAVVGRGYWNDGSVAVNMGWGKSYSNDKLTWARTSYGSTHNTAIVTNMTTFYHQ